MKSDIPNLPESPYLENGMPMNFTRAEWHAVAEDMRRWLLVDQAFKTAKSATTVREWINSLPAGEYRDDMRRRCEIARNRRRALKCR
jgi:hypothetical protein